MENASKALIIAASVLVSILLISFGIMIFNNARDSAGGDQMSEVKITAHNSKFTQYEGTKSGSEVKTLIQQINSTNVSDATEGNGRQITITASGFTLTATSAYDAATGKANTYPTSPVASAGKYTVAISGYDNAGYINAITITKK